MTTTANDTGMPSTTLTKVQELCLRQFKAHHMIWARREKKTMDLATAKHYRLFFFFFELQFFYVAQILSLQRRPSYISLQYTA